MNRLKPVFLSLIAAICIIAIAPASSAQNRSRSCGYCHGNGVVRVFVGNGSLHAGKKQCPHCRQWCDLSGDHYCRCPRCGGSGEIGHKASSGSGFLYPSEAENVSRIMELLNRGEGYYPDCRACGGNGVCPACKGASRGAVNYYNLDAPMYSSGACAACGCSGFCPTCRGGGKQTVKAYRKISEQRKQQLMHTMRDIIRNAMKRTGR